MAPPSQQPRRGPRCVYVNCFGSHPCGSVILYEGRGSWRLQRQEAEGGRWEAKAAMAPAGPGGSPELAPPPAGRLPVPRPRTATPKAREPPRPRDRRRESAPRAEAGPENVSDAFEFYIPLNETAKITKKKKKCAVWNSVYKVISTMMKENEKIRDRMNFKQGFTENNGLAKNTEEESSHLDGRINS